MDRGLKPSHFASIEVKMMDARWNNQDARGSTMGFFLRKSINLGPFRLNLSKSGIGVSTGVRGFGVSTGPAGKKIHLGRGGFYFRGKLPGAQLPMKVVGNSQLSGPGFSVRRRDLHHPRIQGIDQEICALEDRRLEFQKEIRNATRRARFFYRKWLEFVICLRRPRVHTIQGTWNFGLLLVVPLTFAAAILILGTIGRNIASTQWIAASVSWFVALATTGALLFMPTTKRLVQKKLEADVCAASQQRFIEDVERRLEWVDSKIDSLMQERRSIAETIEYRCSVIEERANTILAFNWQTAQGYDFEEFLEKVFANLGLPVSRIGRTGDQGVDLIVTTHSGRIAIQAKGGASTIGNGAVQEALAGMIYHGCDRCGVVTNSRFTASAEELAEKANCCLIDGERLKSLALGWHPWFEPQTVFA